MEKIVDWISNQLNITTIIAVIGLVISVINLVQGILSRRKKLSVRLLSFDVYGQRLILTMSFENCSQLPIAITNIKYISSEGEHSCEAIPIKLSENTQRTGGIPSHSERLSDRLPIQLSPLGATSAIIVFAKLPAVPETGAKSLTFEFCTNRGSSLRKTLELPPELPHLQIFS